MNQRIAIVYGNTDNSGGAERVIFNEANSLATLGNSVQCYLTNPKESCNIASISSQVRVRELPGVFGPPLVRLASGVIASTVPVFRRTTTDSMICHGYGLGPWVGGIGKTLGVRYTLVYMHSLPKFLFLSGRERVKWSYDYTRKVLNMFGPMLATIYARIERYTLRHADRVMSNSNYTAKTLRKIYGIRSEVNYPPVDTRLFRSYPENHACKDLGLTHPIVMCSGRIIPIKNIHLLVEILEELKMKYPTITLAITGTVNSSNASYVGGLRHLAKERKVLDNVKFVGKLNELVLAKLYSDADVYAYPVESEDFGLGPAEAIACGTPSVVWDDSAGPSEIVVEGETGSKVTPYDIREFRDSLYYWLEKGKKITQARGPSSIESRFSDKIHTNNLCKALEV